MKTNLKINVALITLLLSSSVGAKENKGVFKNPSNTQLDKITAGCANTSAKTDLDINNVRAKIFTGGDMWWDLAGTAKYEIPKGSGKTSSYAASLWIGGVDGNGQLKVAGQTYRQNGNDFWAGPISANPVTGATTISTEDCDYYDRHWVLLKEGVRQFVNTGTASDPITAEAITSWPGNGDASKNQLHFLAPFYDANGNGVYEPNNSDPLLRDFPYYRDINPNLDSTDYPISPITGGAQCKEYLFGDKTLWWVFNDVGNIKTESNSDPIGLEIRAQAFGFQTADAINNMTFYQYQIINRSTVSFDSTYIGNWADPDLGFYNDDYAGCDADLGLGFVYNGDAIDDLPDGYGENPPAIGIDYFQGPLADVNDGIDNDRDGCVDCTNLYDANGVFFGTVDDDTLPEQISMALFNSFINDNNAPNGNPLGLNDMYNYLTGTWRDGLRITWGGTGYNPGSTDLTNFMFPGTTDPGHPGQNWTEATANNTPTDKRIVQSAGPFTLGPGAVNYVTTGVVWARATSGGNLASIDLVKSADQKAQALFNNCFKVLDGPNAPDVEIRELDKALIVKFVNTGTKFTEFYSEVDPTIPATIQPDIEKRKYKFQGYKLYQVANNSVTANDVDDLDKARLIAQSDLKDDLSELVNYDYITYNDPNNHGHWAGTVKAYSQSVRQEANKGLKHTFVITRDEFTQQSIINHKSYYFLAVAYAYNNFIPFTDSLAPDVNFTQQHPFFQGRLNVKVYSGIPHSIDAENNGTILNSAYGDGLSVTRIEGAGNGFKSVDLLNDQEALTPPYVIKHPVYVAGRGPINIQIYDPVIVTAGNYELKFNDIKEDSSWVSTELNSGYIEKSDLTIRNANQQLLKGDQVGSNGEIIKTNNWGIMSDDIVTAPGQPGNDVLPNNGFLGASMSFSSGLPWISGVPDNDNGYNWIISGPNAPISGFIMDSSKSYEGVLGGTWAPFKLAANDALSPKWNSATLQPFVQFSSLTSVDVVLTNDKSKWTRSLVLESATTGAIGGAGRFDRRKSNSVDKFGHSSSGGSISTDPNSPNYIDTIGMGWFPGYAVNVETGERLNIAFAENSSLHLQRGDNMLWDPTDTLVSKLNGNDVLGGMHYVYIFGHNGNLASDIPVYDACFRADSLLKLGNTGKRSALKDIIWCNIPLSVKGQAWLSSDARIKLRIAKPFKRFNTNWDTNTWITAGTNLNPGQKYFVYSYGGSSATTAKKAVYNGVNYVDGDYITGLTPAAPFTETGTSGTVVLIPMSNGGNPFYTYNVDGSKVASLNNTDKAKSALDLINVVPNPYYAYSSYEKKQNDNWAKIVNLPGKCTVSIYTLAGKLVRRFNRDVAADQSAGTAVAPSTGTEAGSGNYDTSLDWDLRNGNNVPIGSGVYLIHVKADGLGERTLKWFAVMRPIDVDAY